MRAAAGSTGAFLRAHVGHVGDDCVIWPFCREFGYGIANINGVKTRASRWMCFQAHGEPTSSDLVAAHSCGNRACVNPRHLRWATQTENMADCEAHGRIARGERHGRTPLSAGDVAAIRADGRQQRIIAKDYGISQRAIWSILARKTWGHIT